MPGPPASTARAKAEPRVAGRVLAVVRRRITLAVGGIALGALLLLLGYRFGPSESGGLGALTAGIAIVLGWTALLLVAFMVLVPALLPHR